jgi:hypothetical protein
MNADTRGLRHKELTASSTKSIMNLDMAFLNLSMKERLNSRWLQEGSMCFAKSTFQSGFAVRKSEILLRMFW